ncbi:MAG: hypothetical protein V4547_17040 [Bacteroidota bacterium]
MKNQPPEKSLTTGSQETINELISRYKQRLKTVYSNPNPYDKPLYEYNEIKQMIKRLEKLEKKV